MGAKQNLKTDGENRYAFFSDKVPHGDDKELLEKALRELGYTDEPNDKIDVKILSGKLCELYNAQTEKALEEQEERQKNNTGYG